jgi:hypothetical protein
MHVIEKMIFFNVTVLPEEVMCTNLFFIEFCYDMYN